MKINNELLAAYAEGNVSQEERKTVRQYLMENPQELESVAMMMDENYDLEVEEENNNLDDQPDFAIGAVGGMPGSIAVPSLCMSAAAFAPNVITKSKNVKKSGEINTNNFMINLDNLCDEIY